MRFLALGLLLVGCGSAHAQTISVESIEKRCVIETGEGFVANGSLWMIPADAELKTVPAAVVKLSGLTGYQVSAQASNKAREMVSLRALGDSTWLVSGATRAWLHVTAIDFDRKLFETAVIEVEISKPKPEPKPEPEPKPDPEPEPEPDGDTPLVAKAVVFIEETLDRGKHPERTAAIQKSRSVIQGMGLDYQVIDDDEPDPRWQAFIDQVKPRPAMVIVESVDSIRVFEVPTSADEIETTIRRNIVR